MVLFSSTSGPGSRTVKQFEIRPDSHFVVLHGNEHEAPSTKLTGKVVLMNTDPMTVRNIKITLEGRQKVSYIPMTVMSSTPIQQKRTLYNETINLIPADLVAKNSKGHRIASGSHEWNFEFHLNGNLPESVEGLYDSYVVYQLHAVVERGVLAKDLTAQQHIRVIRTLGQDALSQCAPVENADVWSNKVSYNVTVPSNAVIFGSAVTADIQMTPLRKGLAMGRVQMKLYESIEVKTIAGENGRASEGSYKRDLDVARMEMEFPDNAERIRDVETPDDDYDEAYRFFAKLPLPRSLKQCRQDVDTERIKITHMVRLTVNLHNPEGHVSQLVCKIPIRLFISPNRPPGEDNTVGDIPDHPHEQILNAPTENNVAPPQYGEHNLDVLYSEIEVSGFRTPGVRSGASTPFLQSRNGSSENLAAMDDIVDGVASASILHSRLSNLQEQGSSHWARSQGHNPPAAHTPESYFTSHSGSNSRQSTSQPHSRRHSNEDQEHPSPTNSDDSRTGFDMPALLRTPSYGTAIRTPASRTPPTTDLPSYEAATSRPPSPLPSLPVAPAQAHVHNTLLREANTPVEYESSTDERPRRNVSFADMSQVHGESRRWNDHEGEARLRMIRAKGS